MAYDNFGIIMPQVDSTNKFSEDLASKHEHGPGGQVDPKNNAHSAGTHHVLGHEGDAEGKSGADDKGLIEFQLASQTHLHNVRVQVNWPELWSNPWLESCRCNQYSARALL